MSRSPHTVIERGEIMRRQINVGKIVQINICSERKGKPLPGWSILFGCERGKNDKYLTGRVQGCGWPSVKKVAHTVVINIMF